MKEKKELNEDEDGDYDDESDDDEEIEDEEILETSGGVFYGEELFSLWG